MNLGKLIHALLKRQTAVYVSGLGVFKRVHTPAAFDAKKGVFLPPITIIEFDSHTTEGYDFISYLQQVNQNDRLEAGLQVESAVRVVTNELLQRGQTKLDDLGYLVSYGDSYVFKAIDLADFNYESVADQFYTNVPAEKQVVEELSTDEIVIHNPDNGQTEISLENTSVETDPVTVAEEAAIEEYVEIKSNNSIWYGLVGVLAILIIAGLIYYNYQKPKSILANVPVEVKDSIVTKIGSDTVREAVLQDSLVDSTDSTARVEMPKKVDHRYQIVIGSHRTLQQAYAQAEAFHKDGHKTVKVVNPNLAHNRKKVVWDTYASKAEMDSALQYVQKHIIADAWPDKIK